MIIYDNKINIIKTRIRMVVSGHWLFALFLDLPLVQEIYRAADSEKEREEM